MDECDELVSSAADWAALRARADARGAAWALLGRAGRRLLVAELAGDRPIAALAGRARAERMGLLEQRPAADSAAAAGRLAELARDGVGAALVLAADGALWRWDARRGQAAALPRLRLLGECAGRPAIDRPGADLAAADGASHPRLVRQLDALGLDGQRRLGALTVALVGCGGTGGLVAQLLALAGVGRLVLIDHDRVEQSNRNRLVGASAGDARRAAHKVAALRRGLARLAPDVAVQAIARSLYDRRSAQAIGAADLLIGCTDNEGSRLHMNALAVQHLLPYIDCGVGIEPGPAGLAIGGQVRVVLPGGACLECYEGIDRWRAAEDLAAPGERARQLARGYGLPDRAPAPALAVLNAAIAAEAAASAVALATGLRPIHAYLLYDLCAGQLSPRADARRSSACPACAPGRRYGRGDLLPLPAPAADRAAGALPARPGARAA